MIEALQPRNPEEPHRVATPLELLFDLVTVVAIAAVTAGLHHAISAGHGLEKLPVFIFLFVVLWWAWMNFTWFASAFGNEGPVYRVLVMVIMSGELLFAGGAAHIFETLEIGWGVVGWSIMRIGMAALWMCASATPQYRTTAMRYGIGILIAQAGWIAFYFLARPGAPSFYPLAALFFAIELAVPLFAERARATPFHRHHIIERYGLLLIISLGEVLTGISLGFANLHEQGLRWPVVVTGIAGIVIVFSIFSIYFGEREHLASRKLSVAIPWGYGHVLVFGAVAALGAGIGAESDLATADHHATQTTVSYWIGTSLAVYYMMLWAIRDRYFSGTPRVLALPVMAVTTMAAALLAAPSWIFAVLAVVAALWRTSLPNANTSSHDD